MLPQILRKQFALKDLLSNCTISDPNSIVETDMNKQAGKTCDGAANPWLAKAS